MKGKHFTILLIAMFLLSCNNRESKITDKETKNEKVKKETKKNEGKKNILFFGNSLTAGYGVESEEAYPSLIQKRLDSLGYNYEVINAGVSGETTSGGLSRVDWVIDKQEVDIFVLELGANDGLRGIDPMESRNNLKSIIDKVRTQQPNATIILAGMKVPPNMGGDYSKDFQNVFTDVAEEKKVDLLPFILKDIGGIDSLNQGDKIHPNAAGHKIMAENVWSVLEKHLEK